MIIQSINLYTYKELFKTPIVTPKVTLYERESLIIEFITQDYQSFFGECNAFQTDWYDNETIDKVVETLNRWKPQIIGKQLKSFQSWGAYLEQLEETPATRAAVVMAVYQMYDELPSFVVDYGATVSGLTDTRLNELRVTQPQRIKIKWSSQLVQDIQRIRELDLNCKITIDANESLSVESFEMLRTIHQKDILYIEEPFKSLKDLNSIESMSYPSIAIDEKATSIQNIISIIEHYPIEVVVLKPFRLGGIDKVIEAMNVLEDRGIQYVVGGMYEFGLSRYFTAMLAKEGDYPGDVTPLGYYFEEDIVRNSGILKEGMIYFTPPKVLKSRLKYI